MFKVVEGKIYKEVDIKTLDKKELVEALGKMQDALEISLSGGGFNTKSDMPF